MGFGPGAPGSPLSGRALLLGDHVNADLLHPPAFFSLDPARVRAGFLAGLDREPETPGEARWIIVAGRNFGCGSSRETTLTALREGGVAAVIALSFGRIFRRSATALGLRCFEALDPLDGVVANEALVVDPIEPALLARDGTLRLALARPDPFLEAVAMAGGVLEWLGERRS